MKKFSRLLLAVMIVCLSVSFAFAGVLTKRNTAPSAISSNPSASSNLTIDWTLRNGTVGLSYSDFVSASGGSWPYVWTYSGNIPPGLRATYPNGSESRKLTFSGTPTKAGTYSFRLFVEDEDGNVASKALTVTIASNTSINYTFKDGTVGTYYSDFITVSGGTSPYTWSYTGTLPKGLRATYSGNRLTLSGTPTKAGTYYFTFTVKDSYGNKATKSFTVKVINPMAINYTFKDGTVGTYYSDFVTVSGGTAPYTWTYTGTLPKGLRATYSGTRLTLAGTPTKAGTYYFTFTAKDSNGSKATKSFTVKVINPMVINYTFKDGTVGTYYSDFVTVSGGTAPYTWTYTGTLPKGLRGTYSGNKMTLKGTPTKAGTYNFTLTVKDSNGNKATKSFTVKVINPMVINYTFKDGAVGTSYSDFVTVSGGTAPYTWTYTGTLPKGLRGTYSGNRQTLSGTPTKAGTYNFTLTVKDSNGNKATKSFTVKVIVPMYINYTFKDGTVGTSYSDFVTVSGGTAPYTWTYTGTLPKGLRGTYSGNRQTLSGTPKKAGTYTFTLTVKDSNGNKATKSFTVKVIAPLYINYTLKNGRVGTSYSDYVTVSGGTAPYTWTYTGTLPKGLRGTYSGNKMTLAGTPTKAGTYTFKLTVKDSNGSKLTKSFTVQIVSSTDPISESQSDKSSKEEASDIELSDGKTPLQKVDDTLPSGEDTANFTPSVILSVESDDIVETYEGKDSDMVKVKADTPLHFIVNVSDVIVYVDEKAVDDITVSPEGKFTLPAEIVHDDFKVSAKSGELESEELFIIAE